MSSSYSSSSSWSSSGSMSYSSSSGSSSSSISSSSDSSKSSCSSSSYSSSSPSSSSSVYPSYPSSSSCSSDGCCSSDYSCSDSYGNDPANTATQYPVRYHDGQIQMKVTDMEFRGGAVSIHHKRTYDNLNYEKSGLNGFGWQTSKLPQTSCYGGFYRAEFASNDSVHFFVTPNAQGIYAAHDNRPDTLQIDSAAKTFIVTRKNGTVWTFNNDPKGIVPQGLPISAVAKNGKVTRFEYKNGQLFKVTAYHKDQPDTILAELEYTYSSERLLSILTLCQHDSKVLKPIKRVLYSYYSDEDCGGNTGDLKTVCTEMAINDSWKNMSTYAYRYYKDSDACGSKHALKMAFFPADYKWFVQNTGISCLQISDSEALEYATKYYEYDRKQRVVRERVDRNRKQVSMEYTEYPDTSDLNAVHRKTVEIGPFGNQNIVFTNKRGKVLLREEIAPPGTEEPSAIYYFRFNANGKQTHKYSGGVVLGYTVVTGQKTALELELSPDKGKIEIDEFLENDQNGPKSAFFRKTLQNGTAGNPIVQKEVRYQKFDLNGKPKWKTSQNLRFIDDEAQQPITVSYQYEVFSDTDKVQQKTTILPVIPKEQNGTGIAATTVERFDEKGRMVWRKDELSIIEYNHYDPKTGRRVKTIQDVDTKKTADFNVDVPKGWATVTDAGTHLVTEYEFDQRGRVVQILYPENEAVDENNNAITARKAYWTVYDEVHRRTMSASGYVTTDPETGQQKTTLVNPVSITIHGVGRKIQEEISAARDYAEGRLLATDQFPQSSYVSWTKHLYEGSNRTVTRVYTTIPPKGDGVLANNYEETVYQYDDFGRQNQTIAPNGLITQQHHNWRGYTTEVWQGSNESDIVLMTEMIYGGEGACPTCSGRGAKPRIIIQHVDDEKMQITENMYDWRGRIVETFGEEDTNGQFLSAKNHYDNLGRVVKTEQFVNDAMERKLVACSETFYTPQDQIWCQRKTAADPKTGKFEETQKSLVWFDAKGRQIKSQELCQCLTNMSHYDSLGHAVRSVVLNKDNNVLQETEQVFDNVGSIIQTTTTELSATSNRKFSRKQYSAQWFDPMGRQIAAAQFGTNGGKTFGRNKNVPTGKGLMTRRVYDPKTGLDAAHIDPAGRMTTFTYDAVQRKVKESRFSKNRKLVRETKSHVDVRNGKSVQTDSLGNTTQSISDVFGRLITTIDALGNRTEMVYNRIGELIEQRDPMGRVTRFVYDNLGRRVETILPQPSPGEKNPIRKTVYNALGQVTQEIDPLGNAVSVEYDAFGRRTAQIDAEGGRMEFTYNAQSKLQSLKDPVGNVTLYVYDDAGRVVEETNALGKTRRFEYEGRLLVRKTDRNGRVIVFEYNDFGKQIAEKWMSAEGKIMETILFQYDSLGKLEKVVDSSGTQTLVYDDLDRNTQTVMQLTGLETPITLENTFDEMNRRTQVAAKIGEKNDFVNRYSYDALGKVTGIMQNDKRVEYVYNAAGQRVSASVFAGANKVYDTLYQYDGLGRLTDLTHGNGEKVFANYAYAWDTANRITSMNDAAYGYDKTSQLTSANYDVLPKELYEYDANGNRKNFETGANNLLTSDGEFCYTYDSEGNRVEKVSILTREKTKYIWDHRNRLTQVVMPEATSVYTYDHKNRMTRRNSEFVVHDGWQIVLTSDSKGNVKDRNLWGAIQDELIAANEHFTLCDHLGSVRDIVDVNGKVLNHIDYNAFGQVVKQTGNSDCVFGYTGKMFDNTTGLQWNINRWYDAETGRWISEDPIGFRGNDVNLLRYVNNSLVFFADPHGLLTNKTKLRGFEVTDSYSYTYEGKIYGVDMNQIGTIGTGIPHGWRIAACLWHGEDYAVSTVDNSIGCWSPRFTVYGFVVIVRRPHDDTIVHGIYTNMDIWRSQRSMFASWGYAFASSHADFLNAVNNHELNHYNTAKEAMQIIIAGLSRAENSQFMTSEKARDYGSKAVEEAKRVTRVGRDHTRKFDTIWNMGSFVNSNSHPFTEPYNLPTC